MSEQSERWTTASRVLQARLDDLVWTQAELVRRSGLSDPTISAIINAKFRNGGPPTKHTLARVGIAVGWPTNWVDLADAGEPIPATMPPAMPDDINLTQIGPDTAKLLEAFTRVAEKLGAIEDRVGSVESRVDRLEQGSGHNAAPNQPPHP